MDRTAGSVPVGTRYEPLEGSVPFELLFNRGKGKDALPIADVQRQLQMQVNEANRLIHEAPVTPLVSWQRMRAQMELYEAAARGDKTGRYNPNS